MKHRYTIAALGGVLLLGAAAIAQTISVPQVTVVHPTDLIQVIPNGNPKFGNVYATPAQITSQSGYYKSAPSTGFTFTFGNSQTFAAFAPSTTLATASITFAPNPSDGARECVFSTQIITTLTLNANTGQTLANAATTLAANGTVCYLYSLSNVTWNRSS